jgi:hypothetical protein
VGLRAPEEGGEVAIQVLLEVLRQRRRRRLRFRWGSGCESSHELVEVQPDEAE